MALPANFFENLIITLLADAEQVLPIFIHSKQGLLVLNATEPIVNAALTQVVASPAAPAAPAAS